MLIFRRDENLIVRSEYYPEFIRAIRNVPGAKFNKWEWVVPETEWEALKQNLGLEPAHCYPYLADKAEKNLFPQTQAVITNDRLQIICSSPEFLNRLMLNLEILCGFEEVTDEFNYKKRQRIYYRENVTLLERLREEPCRIIWYYPPGLEHRIRLFLTRYLGIELKDKTCHNIPKPYLIFTNKPKYPARDYQTVIAHKAPTLKRAIIVKPTGSGKTRTAGEITRVMGLNTLFLTDSRLLLKQTAKAFQETLGIPIGLIGAGKFQIQPVTVATAQSIWAILTKSNESEKLSREQKKALMRDLKNKIAHLKEKNIKIESSEPRDVLINYLASVDLQFVDEAHGLGAEYLYLVANLTSPAMSFGLTATYQREDERGIYIEAATGPIWKPVKEQELIEQGYLLPVKVLVVPYKHRKQGIASGRNITKLNEEMIRLNEERNNLISRLANHYSKKYKTLVLVKEIEHGKKLSELIGVPFISSKAKKAQGEAIKALVNGEIPALISSPILEQGVDIKEAELLIDAVPRKSTGKIIQAIGRVRRPGPGKTHAHVITLFDLDDGVYQKQSLRKLHIMQSAGFDINFINFAKMTL